MFGWCNVVLMRFLWFWIAPFTFVCQTPLHSHTFKQLIRTFVRFLSVFRVFRPFCLTFSSLSAHSMRRWRLSLFSLATALWHLTSVFGSYTDIPFHPATVSAAVAVVVSLFLSLSVDLYVCRRHISDSILFVATLVKQIGSLLSLLLDLCVCLSLFHILCIQWMLFMFIYELNLTQLCVCVCMLWHRKLVAFNGIIYYTFINAYLIENAKLLEEYRLWVPLLIYEIIP